MPAPITCLLGPQRFDPDVASVAADLRLSGNVALVTAGWQEREAEDQELRDHLTRPAVNLELYRRAETVYREDPELSDALRSRQERLRRLQRIYRIRLAYAMDCVRDLFRRKWAPEDLEPEREDALEAVRALDRHHLERVREVHREFEDRVRPGRRPAVVRQREELAGILETTGLVLIAGGHVAALLNRARLFGLQDLVRHLPVIGWSAGAMVLASRVVLFHDSPPQGAGNAELLDAGMDRCSDVLPLPRAAERLRLDDPVRVAILARRFHGRACIALDPGSRVTVAAGRRITGEGTLQLFHDGTVHQASGG